MTISNQERLSLSYSDTFQDLPKVHDIFSRLRAEDPVAWCPEPWGGPGFWSITKYDDIQFVGKSPELFGSDADLGGITLSSNEMIRTRLKEEGRTPVFEDSAEELRQFEGGKSMISMDPPVHVQHRRMLAPGFTPQKLTALASQIRNRASELLDRIKDEKEVDFVSSVAAELPIQMLAELFAIDQSMRHKLFEWSNIIIGGDDPDMVISQEQVRQAFMELAMFAMQVYQERKEDPGEDLISMLVHSEIDGEPLTIQDYLSAMILLVVAGNETTRNSISGGIWALSEHPEEKQKLLDNPCLIPSAVAEIIRWVHPVIYMRRTAVADGMIAEQEIKKGDKLAMWYISGNRDEDQWADPFEFNVTREGPRHLSFGHGQHLCIGWRLAEMQLTIVLEEVLSRFPDIRVSGEVNRLRSNFLNSPKTMQVVL